MYRHNGAGEMLVFSAADFEDFREPRPELAPVMEDQLYAVTRHLAENRWPFRIHGTYDESISRFLDVFERVNRRSLSTASTGSSIMRDDQPPEHRPRSGDGRRDRDPASNGLPGRRFRRALWHAGSGGDSAGRGYAWGGRPGRHGTDATRVASYNPWIGIDWLVSGKTVGGTRITPSRNQLDRETALRLYTEGSAWFSTENGRKGAVKAGQYADFAVLDRDLFEVREDQIARPPRC
jgi:predicted amidohydrolase YtcJ